MMNEEWKSERKGKAKKVKKKRKNPNKRIIEINRERSCTNQQ
jgi:hypothetical protein